MNGCLRSCSPWTMRNMVKLVRQIQMMMLVGRRTQASAARSKQRLSLLLVVRRAIIVVPWIQHLSVRPPPLASSSSFSGASSRMSLASSRGSSDQCQGHASSAATVSVVSRLFENVRVAQNHCHGLRIVKPSCAKPPKFSQQALSLQHQFTGHRRSCCPIGLHVHRPTRLSYPVRTPVGQAARYSSRLRSQ